MPLSLKRKMSCKGCNEKLPIVLQLPKKWYLFVNEHANALMAIQEKSLEWIIALGT